MKKNTTILCFLIMTSAFLMPPPSSIAVTGADYQAIPPFVTSGAPPLLMLVMGRNHKLYYEAYNDASDLNSDGVLDIRYTPSQIDYYGYFDSYKCYKYSSANARFEPNQKNTDKKCQGADEWSGDFLNYITMSRMDTMRKVLYGGYRSTDTTGETVLERVFIPQDAHSWAKEYTSVAVDGFDIADYTPFQVPSAPGLQHLFGSTTLNSSNDPPVLRVALNNPHRVWEWASKEAPVIDDSIVISGGGHPGHPLDHAAFEAMVYTYATSANLFGSGAWLNYSSRNHIDELYPSANSTTFGAIDGYGNPWGSSGYDPHSYNDTDQDNYLAVFTGTLHVNAAGDYDIAVDGDDAVEVIIDGGTSEERVVGYYGPHGSCNCTDHNQTVYLDSGNHTVEFRMEEAGGADKYYLYWNGPDSGNAWTIIPNTAFTALTLSTYRFSTPASTITNYDVRVKVCDPSIGIEANCKLYPDGNYKPIGILQRHGESKRMYFGLLTGSWAKNTSGGVLRKQISDISDEIDSDNGIYWSSTHTSTDSSTEDNGIIQTLNKMHIYGYSYSARNYNQDCGWITNGPMTEGHCRDWGNPVAEMMYETERYFAGKKSASQEYDYSGTTDDTNLGLPKVSWNDPYDKNDNGFDSCAKPFMLVLSDINPTYDADQLPGVDTNFGSGLTGDLTGMNVKTLADTISTAEGITGNKYIGQSGNIVDGACTAKTITGLGDIRGLCPEEPTKGGGYYSAAVSYYGHTTDLQSSVTEDQKVSTYAVGLASPLPRIELNIGGHPVTLVPFAKTVGSLGSWGSSVPGGEVWPYWPTNTIVDFYVQNIGPTSGTFRINYEDVEQGADHDMDDIVTYEYQLVDSNGNAVTDPANATAVDITLSAGYASGSFIQHAGYIISGTTKDGTYLEVTDTDTGAGNDLLVFLDTPPGTDPIPDADAVAPHRDKPGNTHNSALGTLPLQTTRRFTPSSGSSSGVAELLKGPLWYAAKWGAFEDKDGDNTPNLQEEWDKDKDGVPDTYYYVTNPLRLEEQLNKSFADILNRASSGTAASVISNTRSGEGAIYQSVFYPNKTDSTSNANTVSWVGQVHSFLMDAYGNMREDSNGNAQLDILGPDLNGDGRILHEDVNMNCILDTEDANGNHQLDSGEDLNGNNELDTEDTNGNGVLDVESTIGTCIPSSSVATDPYLSRLDAIIEYVNGKAVRYYDVNGNQILDPAERIWNAGQENLNLDEVRYLWNSSDWLNDTTLDPVTQRSWYISDQKERYIFTWVDTNANGIVDTMEVQDFTWPSTPPGLSDLYNTDNFYPYLTLYPTFADKPVAISNLSTQDFNDFLVQQTEREINWIRGEDYVDSHGIPVPLNIGGGDVPGTEMRSRRFDGKTWRLGDIAYSTPTMVGRPSEAFHLLYKDPSYADFAARYQDRRNVIYAGANDGMLHAFNGGFFDSYHSQFCREIVSGYNPYDGDTANDIPCASFTSMPELGAELWAYVPYNLLPHLYWLTETTYGHVYYVDEKPRVFDAKIFQEESACNSDPTSPACIHPHGWGTVMVVGMRFGGGQISTDVNRDDHPDYVSESYTDSNGNGQYDIGEQFVDCNDNNIYDTSPVIESYTDKNGNGTFDATASEPFTDYNGNNTYDSSLSEPFVDCNGSNSYDASIFESYVDTNGNNQWDSAEPFNDWNTNGRYDNSVDEPFVDCNGNGSYDVSAVDEAYTDCNSNNAWDSSIAEAYTDANGNGQWNGAESFTDWNGNHQYDASVNEPFNDCNGNGSYDASLPREPFVDRDGDSRYDPGESYTDWNGNNQYDISVNEPFLDYNNNQQHDASEPYTDWNGNGRYDSGIAEPFVDSDGDQHWDARESYSDCNGNHTYDAVTVAERFTDWNSDGSYSTSIHEPFVDVDGNNQYTHADPFSDCNGNGHYDSVIAEPFTDCNHNNSRDTGITESFTDWNGDGSYSTSVPESYTDSDGNGQYTYAEQFTDCNNNGAYDSSLAEPYTDWNHNNQYDASLAEPFTDWNNNHQHDMGGGEPFVDCNGDGVRAGLAPMKSAFIVMDITNPEEKPTLLAELVMPEMGYSTSYPTVVPIKKDGENKWFLAFGSGPADINGQPDKTLLHSAQSFQKGKFYLVDLVKLASLDELWSVDINGVLTQGFHVYTKLEDNAFVTTPITVDYNLDYNADVVYYGTISGDAGNGWAGKLHRIVIDNFQGTTTWWANTLIDVGQPISAAPTVGLDNVGRNWVFFGTGRYFVNSDKADKSLQSFYGIKEPLDSNDDISWNEVQKVSLHDVTSINVFTDTQHTVTGLGSGTTWTDLISEQETYDGWLLDFYADDGSSLEGERNLGQAALIGGLLSFTTFIPSDDICIASGESNLWALYYKTGTAYYTGILGTTSTMVNGNTLEKANRKISLGQGLATSPSIHVGREKGSVVFVQSSTGEIKRIEEENPLSTKSGRLSWKQQ